MQRHPVMQMYLPHAAAQVKKGIETAKELGAENYVFWGGREGYDTLLNTDMKRELDHLATFCIWRSIMQKKSDLQVNF